MPAADFYFNRTLPPTPMPVNDTIWGLSGALSVMLTSAFRVPEAVGEKTTVIKQWPPGANVFGFIGQLLLSEKSPLSDPVMAMLEISNGAPPLFVRVTVCGVLSISRP